MKLKKIVEHLHIVQSVHKTTKCLVALDIDETILYFEEFDRKWWTKTFDNNYKTIKCYDTADQQTLKDWQNLISIHKPKMVDSENFNMILNLHETKALDLVFVTARDKGITDVTIKHFEQLGIPTHLPIIFCGSTNKGTALAKHIKEEKEKEKYKHIIFADDIQRNIDDVEKEFETVENIVLKTFLIE